MMKRTQVLLLALAFVVTLVLGYLLCRFGFPSWWRSLLLNVTGSLIAVFVLYCFYIACSVWASRNKACAELWWIPRWNCFRYVIRNMAENRPAYDITDIRSRAWLRDVVPKGEGCGDNSFKDVDLVRDDRVMIPEGDDYVLVCFRLTEVENGIHFVRTNKFGGEEKTHVLSEEFTEFLVEYSAKIQTGWLLKYEINRTYVIPKFHDTHGRLLEILLAMQEDGKEALFPFLSWRARVIRVSI